MFENNLDQYTVEIYHNSCTQLLSNVSARDHIFSTGVVDVLLYRKILNVTIDLVNELHVLLRL